MANYHLSIKIFSRGKGASAVAKAAYRAGELLTSAYDGQTHNYTRKRGVVYKEILLPDHAPAEYADRSVLWNTVEMGEKQKNAQLAREIEVSLPIELTREQNIALARTFIKQHFVDAGMCADLCVHDKDGTNPHAHIMLTMRPLEPDGSWGAKCHKVNGRKINAVDWNDLTKAEEWRAAWSAAVNAALEREGEAARVDHRSYARQGVEQIPTVHLGVAATQMEKRGIRTDLGNKNREIAVANAQLRQLRARINKLKDWTNMVSENTAPELYDVVMEILDGRGDRRRGDLNTAMKILIFLQANHIKELPQLQDKVSDMRRHFNDVSQKLKAKERRLATLDEHIRQAETYLKHGAAYRQYQEQKPNKREAFLEKHRAEITLYEAAKRYLDAHLNGHDLPLKAWKSERAALTIERDKLVREYAGLKEEVHEVEIIRCAAERIMNDSAAERDAKRGRELVV